MNDRITCFANIPSANICYAYRQYIYIVFILSCQKVQNNQRRIKYRSTYSPKNDPVKIRR
jgi:hypothetical protein